MTEFSLNLMKRSETTKIYRDRAKMAGLLLLCILASGGCFMIFWQQAGTGKIPWLREDCLWLSFGVIAVGIPFFVIKIIDGRPAMEFSDAGLLATDIARDVIPWTAIRSVAIQRYRRNRFLELQIDPEILRGLRLNPLHSKLRVFNKLLGFPHYNVLTSCLIMTSIFS